MLHPVPPTPSSPQAELHDELYREGVQILRPYLPQGNGITPGKPVDLADIERGRRLLTRALDLTPANWSAYWFLGMACRVAGYKDEAYQAFSRAWAINPNHVDVGRELVLQCCINGRGAEAVQISNRVLALRPDDAGLLSNHALALLLAGEVGRARFFAARATSAAPDNRAAHGVAQVIEDVIFGRMPRPTKWPWDEPEA
jgi:tetratricopeptide (TPR) repeat protein